MIITEYELRAKWHKDKKKIIKVPAGSIITPSAKEFLASKGVAVEVDPDMIEPKPSIFSGSERKHSTPKPEYSTYLNSKSMVPKTDPRIAFRGQLDSMIAAIVEAQTWFINRGDQGMADKLKEVGRFCRSLMMAEVRDATFEFPSVFGLDQAQLREVSHHPNKYFGVHHSSMSAKEGAAVAKLHMLRTKSREAELAAADAFLREDGLCLREDILLAMNRLSSIIYILVCIEKARGNSKELSSVKVENKPSFPINVGVSNRHIHLSQKDLETLFGKGYQLTKLKDLSQPGQFAAVETLDIEGPKGTISKVRILGPTRSDTQIEISVSDSMKLGINPPVRDSGDIQDTPGLTLKSQIASLSIDKGAIVAKRHLHLDPATASKMGLKDRDIVSVRLHSERPLDLEGVLVRVSDKYAPDLHIDVDEANAALAKNGDIAEILF